MIGIRKQMISSFGKAKLLFRWRRLGAPSARKWNQNKDNLLLYYERIITLEDFN